MALRLRVGLLHVYNVVVKDGLYRYFVGLRGTPELMNGFGRAQGSHFTGIPVNRPEPGFFKEGELCN